jgi:uncharacterized protein (DUF924 family)
MTTSQSTQDPRAVLSFWFDTEAAAKLRVRKEWFQKNDAFDKALRDQFLALYESAARGDLAHWQNEPRDCLALILIVDQFPRNMFRGQARAFATDLMALAATRRLTESGQDLELHALERQFVYLPLEHSESLADQNECLERMTALKSFEETASLHVWAEQHRAIIERFGRFPHRNAALGRESTAQEIEFLKSPGSGF